MAREIFISYSRYDKDFVHPFVEQINQALGIDCWIDLNGIESGEEFEEVIMKAIDECEVVLFMLSDSSLKSKWTKREVYYAEDEGKRIVPVLVNGGKLRGWFKFHFGNINFIDIHSEEQKRMLVENLRTWLGSKKAEPLQKLDEKAMKMAREAQAENEARKNYLKGNEFYVKGDYEEAVKLYIKAVELGYEDAKNALEKAKQNAEKEAKRKAEEEHQKKLKELENIALKPIEKDGKWGFADEAGNVVIPCKWKDTRSFSEGLARVQEDNGKWGFIDKTGKVVIPCKWESALSFSEGMAAVEDDNWKWGYIDKTGKVVIPYKWKDTRRFSEGLAAVVDDNGKWGYIDKTGEVVIPCKWKFALYFSEGMAAVMDDNWKWGYIDKTGKVVIPYKWKDTRPFSQGLAAVMDDNGKWGYIDKTGKVVIPYEWEDTRPFSEGLAAVMDDNGKRWIIDKTGTVVSEMN